MGHVERVCRSKLDEAKIFIEQHEEDLFLLQNALLQAIVHVTRG